MSEHAGEENHPTEVRRHFIFAASVSACSSVMFILAFSPLSIALRPSSPMFATAWCAHVAPSATSPSPPLPLPPITSRAALRAGAARSFIVDVGRSCSMLARSFARNSVRRSAWNCSAVSGSGEAGEAVGSSDSASAKSPINPKASASAHASARVDMARVYLTA